MIKIEKENIEGITVYSRGKNRDEDGNPYYAYKCIVEFKWDRDHCTSKLVIDCRADWGDSGKDDVMAAVKNKLEKTFGIKTDWDDVRSGFIKQHHRTVYTMAALEHPESWRI